MEGRVDPTGPKKNVKQKSKKTKGSKAASRLRNTGSGAEDVAAGPPPLKRSASVSISAPVLPVVRGTGKAGSTIRARLPRVDTSKLGHVFQEDKRFPYGYPFHKSMEGLPRTCVSFNMLLLSSLAYTGRKNVDKVLEHWGYTTRILLEFSAKKDLEEHSIGAGNRNPNTLFPHYIAANDEHIVVVYRGTELLNMFQWLQDLTYNLTVPKDKHEAPGLDFGQADGGPKVHRGFWKALTSKSRKEREPIFDHLVQVLDKLLAEKRRKVYIAGHSLGSALATLTGFTFWRRGLLDSHKIDSIHAFAPPRVGNQAFARRVNESRVGKMITRYVWRNDVCARLPPTPQDAQVRGTSLVSRSLYPKPVRDYGNVGRLIFLDEQRGVQYFNHDLGVTVPDVRLKTVVTGTVCRPLRAGQHILGGKPLRAASHFCLPPIVNDHIPISYLQAFYRYFPECKKAHRHPINRPLESEQSWTSSSSSSCEEESPTPRGREEEKVENGGGKEEKKDTEERKRKNRRRKRRRRRKHIDAHEKEEHAPGQRDEVPVTKRTTTRSKQRDARSKKKKGKPRKRE